MLLLRKGIPLCLLLPLHSPGCSGATSSMSTCVPQHGGAFVDAVIDDEEVVVAWEQMLVHEVHASLFRRGAYLVAVLYEATVLTRYSVPSLIPEGLPTGEDLITYGLLSPLPSSLVQRVVVLANVQTQEMLRWEVLSTFRASIGVCLCIMHIKLLVR